MTAMSDTYHAERVKAAASTLQQAVTAAGQCGLHVEIETYTASTLNDVPMLTVKVVKIFRPL